ncbi:MAG TPA: S8 family serine peptidase [Micromonosporaceae bacterium]|nr:S8 family serine peptidase [Micromonosporaceae bacterium]
MATLTLSTLAALLVSPAAASAAEPTRSDQWQLAALDMATAWQYADGAGVTVAVLDSGVDASHPDLAGQVLPGIDLVDGTTKDGRADPVGHGTSVAALIAGRADDSTGAVGIAPRARILPVRVLDTGNKYDDAAVVARGLRWAVDQGASVVNMSLGGAARSAEVAAALRYAGSRNVVVIACTGNSGVDPSGSDRVWYPARELGVVAVAGLAAGPADAAAPGAGAADRATADNDREAPRGATAEGEETESASGSGGAAKHLWPGSLTGPQTVLTAPGANLLGARPGGYWRVQGTSFAAPLVTATAALIRSRWPTMSAANVINRLVHTARDLGVDGRDDRYGYGEVNPVGALTWPVAEVGANPLVGGAAPAGPDRAPTPPAQPTPPFPPTPSGPAQPAPSDPAGEPSASADQPAAARTDGWARWRLASGLAAGAVVLAILLLVGLGRLRRRWPGSGGPQSPVD